MTGLPEPTTADAVAESQTSASGAASTSVARVIAGRYELDSPVGHGGFGTVWSARDRLSNTRVAVKFWNVRDSPPTRIRREVASLRLLRVPGVVHLFDEGRDGDDAFLVMELIEGVPFPGKPNPVSWSDIAPTVIALLDTLALVHAHGVVHRDLKPSNILVDVAGRPTLLDFGIAYNELDATLTSKNQTLGTPAYLAPEQFAGEPVAPGTDLYALGTILYEALSGDLPFGRIPRMAMMFARTFRQPPPLRDVAPDVPSFVAEAIDSMLGRSPVDRPRSAGAVIAMLRGRASLAPADDGPNLLDEALVSAIVARARSGQAVDVVGAKDSGHTRALREAARQLAAEARRVIPMGQSQRPLASLGAFLPDVDTAQEEDLGQVERRVESSLRAALVAGAVVIAEECESVDRWSRAVLDRVRAHGVVLRGYRRAEVAAPDALLSEAVSEASLRTLIAGPDRLLHLQEDGAQLLRMRSGGLRLGVEREARRWIASGFARWDGARLVLRRDDLARIEAAPHRMMEPMIGETPWQALPEHLRDLAIWTVLAWPRASIALLAKVIGVPRWEIEAITSEMVRLGVARCDADERVAIVVPIAVDAFWSADRVDDAHRALAGASPPGSEARLTHLLAAPSSEPEHRDAVVRESIAVARQLAGEGRLARAEITLRESLVHLRRLSDDEENSAREVAILAEWIDVSLAQNTPFALDRVLYEVSRARQVSPMLQVMETLARAALAARTSGEHALATASAMPRLDDPRLEWWRHSVRVIAARRCSIEEEARVLEDVSTWVEHVGTPEATASLAAWRARLRYRQGRFAEAATLWLEAERIERQPERRLSAMTGAASGLMEVGALEQAEALAQRALGEARAARHVYFEARAEWLIRSSRYRAGCPLTLDAELIDAIGLVGVSDLEALVCLTESAIAWRTGDHDACVRLAERVIELWSRSGWTWPVVLPRGLVVLAGRTSSLEEAREVATRAAECPIASVGIQAMGLISLRYPTLHPELRASMISIARSIVETPWNLRMEVLSVREALDAVGAP